ncbi:Alpha-ketoglutaric semialdehyde dehydrogenase 1 (plasmid) [Sphingobium sp. AntQ-1]|uniref:NAD-dependent succinate-semialdehyde dehydrogenase n=1 Tax=Sphingobium sp. AntQ-1 TaxID=2930091 RepID=UPI00234E390A|nr:NAD-dependent succinate-semialdehyde dehydrogenase [Sphingobium sp. AntQ-1]WCP15992.1 Alpha-ketoglutaric semialdehyde dehydrogenase 1 [Sphingobium sp. AntQ-1]
MYPDTQLLIDGSWRDGATGRRLHVLDPSSGKQIGCVAVAEKEDLEAAVAAARRMFGPWRDVGAFERAALLRRAATLLRERCEALSPILTMEMGKPLAEARGEILSSADLLDWFAGEGQRAYGRVVPARSAKVSQIVLKQPVGPVAAFTPWNFPMSLLVRKLGPALAVGCTVVAKPPEISPAAPAALARALMDAGLPQGVLNLVYGVPQDIANFLIPHPSIRKVSFTGSVEVGKQLAALAGMHMKRITMELGGHNPALVFEDADIEEAARQLAAMKFRNAGQVCISPTRFLVQRSVYSRFAEAFRRHVETIRVGAGLDSQTQMGPLVSAGRLAAVSTLVSEATSEGAQVVAEGARDGAGEGWFFSPIVLENVDIGSRLLNEEPFGPIAIMRPFDTIEEAIEEANRLAYGLAAYAFTSSIRISQILQNELETGTLAINHTMLGLPELPLGGVKDSGIGSEGGAEAIEAYLVTKLVTQAAI